MADYSLPQFAFNQLAPQPFAQPQPVSAPAHPSIATMPSIGAWASNLPQAPPPVTPGSVTQNALAAEKLRSAQRENRGYNALAQLYQDPSNVDASGLLKPDAMAQLMAVSPETGMTMMGEQGKLVQQQMATRVNAQKFMDAEQQQILGEYEPLLTRYDSEVKSLGPQAARRNYDEAYAQMTDRVTSSGRYTAATIARLNKSPDPERLRTNLLGLKGMQDREQQVATGRRQDSAEIRANKKEAREELGEPEYVGTVNGKEVPLIFRPGQGYFDATGQKVTGATGIHKMSAGTSTASSEAIESTAEAVASYRQAPPSGYTVGRGIGAEIMRKVREINPDYDAGKWGQAQRVRSDFASGVASRRVDSLNATIQHLGVFDDLAKALQNRDTNAINRLLNYVNVELGHPEVTNFNVAKGIIADEVIKSVVGSGAVFDREGMQKNLASARSPEQLAQMAAQIKKLMAGQMGALEKRWTSTGLSDDEFREKLLPDTVAALEKDLPANMRRGAAASGQSARGNAQSGGLPLLRPGDDAQYDALPPGASYRFQRPDGRAVTMTKP